MRITVQSIWLFLFAEIEAAAVPGKPQLLSHTVQLAFPALPLALEDRAEGVRLAYLGSVDGPVVPVQVIALGENVGWPNVDRYAFLGMSKSVGGICFYVFAMLPVVLVKQR